MNRSKVLTLSQMAYRQFSKSTVKCAETEVASKNFQKLKEVQKKFGINDNVPVHLKGGLFDKMLYQATAVITLIGLGLSFQTFYELSVK